MSYPALISQLLYEEEGSTLDFKSEQYKFSGATDNEKGELLKDIIAFANTFKRSDAYIIIGAKEVKGGRSTLLGIEEHLDDAHLQQFINSKTQRPIEFSYRTVEIDEKKIGLIHIPIQKRPFCLKNDFGKLKANLVYLRRGSSTAVATVDEISTMGIDISAVKMQEAKLEAFLVMGKHGEIVEKNIAIQTINITFPNLKQIPDYPLRGSSPFLYTVPPNILGNSDFFRKKAKYLAAHSRVKSFSVCIKNSGELPARDVKIVLTVNNENESTIIHGANKLPDYPDRDININSHLFNRVANIPDIIFDQTINGWRITCNLGKIQPQETVTTKSKIYIGAISSKAISISGEIYSDDLPKPKNEIFQVNVETKENSYSIDQITRS